MEFVYEPADLDRDMNGICDVANASFNHFAGEAQFRDRLADKKSWVYVARAENGKIVGFKAWYEENGEQIYSWLGAVHPDFRRQGIASRLMDIQFDQARGDGYSRIALKTHAGHPEMIAFALKEGFEEIRRDPNHWQGRGGPKEAIFFEKNL